MGLRIKMFDNNYFISESDNLHEMKGTEKDLE